VARSLIPVWRGCVLRILGEPPIASLYTRKRGAHLVEVIGHRLNCSLEDSVRTTIDFLASQHVAETSFAYIRARLHAELAMRCRGNDRVNPRTPKPGDQHDIEQLATCEYNQLSPNPQNAPPPKGLGGGARQRVFATPRPRRPCSSSPAARRRHRCRRRQRSPRPAVAA